MLLAWASPIDRAWLGQPFLRSGHRSDSRKGLIAVSSLTPAERSLRARVAAHTLHATHDSTELTKNARQAFRDRFERQVDPDGVLPPAERERRAEHARKAWYTTLALKSAQARRRRKA